MKPDTNATHHTVPCVGNMENSNVPRVASLCISANSYIVEGKISVGINSATKSLEWDAFLQPRLGVSVGPEAMEGVRGQPEPQTPPPLPTRDLRLSLKEPAWKMVGCPELVEFEQKTRAQLDT